MASCKSILSPRFIAALMTLGIARQGLAADAFVTPADLAAGKTIADAVLKPATPPFSFTYDGRPSSEVIAQWNPQSQEKTLDGGRTQQTVTWKDPAGGLSVKMVSVRYGDSPASEWTVFLRNDGTADTKLIDNLRGIDATIGHAPAAASTKARTTWSPGKTFPAAASGEAIQLYRGWGGEWRPLVAAEPHEGHKRFATEGHEPWIAADPEHNAILMMPAQGTEAATDAPGTGKSPAAGFTAPADGIYRVRGTISKVGTGGDGVEWQLHNFANAVFSAGTVEDSKPAQLEYTSFFMKGERVGLTFHSRATPEGDLCRVNFEVTQLTDVVDGDVVVHSNKGSEALDTDYQPVSLGLGAGESIDLTSRGGRPSDFTTVPYFNFQMPTGGAILAIGWPGQWASTFSRQGDDVRVAAGQEGVKLALHPGEEIRTPLIAVLPYAGTDPQHGQNLWRRWMVDHNMPRVDGKLRGNFVAACSSHQTAEMTKGNEANQIGYIKGYLDNGLKLDYWWMDAGWYFNDGNWVNTGTWKVDTNRFPNGLRAVSDYGKGRGVGTIVWFEPERVTRNSELYDEHPDFLLTAVPDLNNPSAGLVSRSAAAGNPCVVFNPLDRPRYGGPLRWAPKQMTFHPGPNGEYSDVRFTAPADGAYHVAATFAAVDATATTDVHVIHADQALFDDFINVNGKPAQAKYDGKVALKKGETIDFVLGRGNGKYESDTTGLTLDLSGPDGKKYELAAGLDLNAKNSEWTFGSLPAGEKPASAGFVAFPQKTVFGENADWKLLNLGNPTARQWITDRVDSIIKAQGINLYRQDFNIAPLPYWHSTDGENRHGITENLYIQGYMKYWDDLVARNPGLWIDSCASGGRRNDLETMRRAVPLTRSDRLFVPIGQQGQMYGISQWIPHSGNGVLMGKSTIFPDLTGEIDPYYFRSQISASLTLCADTMDRNLDFKTFGKLLAEFREISPNYYGDYYPLMPHSLQPDVWVAWQYDVPAKGSGMVQAFRRDTAAAESMKLKLQGLDRAATYEVTDVDHPEAVQQMTGTQLLDEGYGIKITKKPGAAVIRYARQK